MRDIVIAGGGMVGASLALAAARLSFSVAMIEAFPPGDAGQPSYDERSTALSWGSRLILQDLGVWQAIAPHVAPIERIHVSQRGYLGVTRLDRREEGVEALGYVVPNRCLGDALYRALEKTRVEILTPARVENFVQRADHLAIPVIQGQDSFTLAGRLLVGADGTASAVRSMAGIETEENAYGQVAIIANITPGREHEAVAYERFTDEGPIALLPLPPDESGQPRCSLVWVRPREKVDETLALDDRGFLDCLQQRFGHRLGIMARVGRRAAYPLNLVRARRHTGQRLVLVGNASHTIHPVAGQGFNLALRDVSTLSGLLEKQQRKGGDPGDPALLADYERLRRRDLAFTIGATDLLARHFANASPPLAHLRGLGLMLVDRCGLVRRQVARLGMGC